MRDQVRAIFRVLTGGELPEAEPRGTMPLPVEQMGDVVAQRFADLEAMGRSIPQIAERVPPFAFAPPVDVIEDDKEMVVEMALPGVVRDDLHVDLNQEMLAVWGVRYGEKVANGRAFRHAEIPRGPFRRVLLLPKEVTTGKPRVELENGVARIHLSRITTATVAKA
jgi:HSP20 family protein